MTVLVNDNAGGGAVPMHGTIRTYVVARGFGFVRPDNGGDDLFFHRNDVVDVDTWRIATGTAVTFDMGSSPKGPRAIRVAQAPRASLDLAASASAASVDLQRGPG